MKDINIIINSTAWVTIIRAKTCEKHLEYIYRYHTYVVRNTSKCRFINEQDFEYVNVNVADLRRVGAVLFSPCLLFEYRSL